MSPTEKGILYLLHHVFLPPQLPSGEDDNSDDELLLETVLEALHRFKDSVLDDGNAIFASIITMIRRLKETRDSSGDTNEASLREALVQLSSEGGFLPVHIRTQNAALLMTKCDSVIHVEAFELSPRNKPVITTLGRLRRSFPGPALALHLDTFNQSGFVDNVAFTLARMSHQAVAGTKPKVTKARQKVDEERDTTHPKVITELFMNFLRPMSENADVSRICKNTREEVIWSNSKFPWRRSSLWLLIRVTMQLVLSRQRGVSADIYKHFMIFFMSHVLNSPAGRSLGSEYLHVMNAKISRRLLKLDIPGDTKWVSFVERVLKTTENRLDERWRDVIAQSSHVHDLSSLQNLCTHDDVHCNLPELDEFIAGMTKRGTEVQASKPFTSQLNIIEYDATELPDHSFSNSEYQAYELFAFEHWVAENLNGWLKYHLGDDDTCGKLGRLMKCYHQTALPFYYGDPEAVSKVLLVTLELWIACDKSATYVYKMLNDYDPCVPIDLFQSLMLPFKSQMARMARAESYMRHRRDYLVHQGPGIYQDFGTHKCFSVRYFDQSTGLQRLHAEIDDRARKERQQKKRELQEKKNTYLDLMDKYERNDCEYWEVSTSRKFKLWEHHHSTSCRKCAYKKDADSLGIEIHEWPLPANPLQSKSTVFELEVPQSFGHWRDTTMFFLMKVLGNECSAKKPRATYPLPDYAGLRAFFKHFDIAQRVGLLSQDKPHWNTHRRDKKIINMTKDDVCLNNGLNWRYYDKVSSCFIGDFETTYETMRLCVYQFPPASSTLQRFLLGRIETHDGPPPNEVLASQDACPHHISLAEYKALCTIPLGVKIQWQNILLQLCMPSVDFKKIETCIFILQTINQAGPPKEHSVLRKGHGIFHEKEFAAILLDKIAEFTERIQENWESAHGLCAFICLTSRVLSLTPSEEIRERCFNQLRHFQGIAFKWVELVKGKASDAVDDRHRNNLIRRTVHLALVCVNAFNTEDRYLPTLLETPSAASIFYQCCMIIQDWKKSLDEIPNVLLPILYQRWKSLCYRSFPMLANEILYNKSQALDLAIKRSWTAFERGSSWSAVDGRTHCWIFSHTAPHGSDGTGLPVHFNLLTGELLVNGLPLVRLPPNYESHSSYDRLFGNSILEIMPSDTPGMQFSAKKAYMGYTLHLGLADSPGCAAEDLHVQATKEGATFELVPLRVLEGRFPDAFVKSYVHWYDMDEGCVEFRPKEKAWTSSDSNWRLKKDSDRNDWVLVKDEVSLVNMKSLTAQSIANILHPIENPTDIHCILHRKPSNLEIELPLLHLGFSLQPGSSFIESKQFRGMAIDANQSLDSLVGLRNRILIKHTNGHERMVLVPDGAVSFCKYSGHVEVTINRCTAVKAQAYTVDEQLGRLVDNGSLRSKLLLCYLHALTSFCVPDPLTRRTGTEQALSILRTAAVRSSEHLQPGETEILAQVAALTPVREYYPANEQVMQTIHWQADLGFLAQHAEFHPQVVDIFDQDRRMRMFYPDLPIRHPQLPQVEANLLKRDRIRSSIFRVSGFGAEDHTLKHDCDYVSLDCDQGSAQGSRAFVLSKLIYSEIPATRQFSTEKLLWDLWHALSNVDRTLGPDGPVEDVRAKYDAGFILEPNRDVAGHWSIIHRRLLRPGNRQLDRFQAMIWLSTMAFAEEANMAVLETLAALYTISEMNLIDPPFRASFALKYGYEIDRYCLRQVLQSALSPLSETPEEDLTPDANETWSKFQSRQSTTFDRKRNSIRDEFISALVAQWPIRTPNIPTDNDYARFAVYLNVQDAWARANRLFNIWFDNKEFREYLHRISNVLSHQIPHLVGMKTYSFQDTKPAVPPKRRYVCVDDLVECEPPVLDTGISAVETLRDYLVDGGSDIRLEALLDKLRSLSKSGYEKRYVDQLRYSVESLAQIRTGWQIVTSNVELKHSLFEHLRLCRDQSRKIYDTLSSHMRSCYSRRVRFRPEYSTNHANFVELACANQWPRISPILLLQQLTRHRWDKLTDNWKICMVAYARSITAVQRAERLVDLIGNPEDLLRELRNPGHSNWDPLKFPETLLLEVENGLLVRDVQEQIAGLMRSRTTQEGNAVMQLNMGEGKSSVIVPIVSAALANSSCLVRVLVAKPQSRQMLQMLVSKLGGLLDRRIYHMPVSRSLKFGKAEADEIEAMGRECMSNGGVLLVQPEHLLSLKLMGIECFVAGNEEVGRSVLRTLELFRTSSRDVVDESDENFSVKFELVYTMGSQCPVELSPQRWVFIHQVLDLVRKIAPKLKTEFPESIEVDDVHPGGFPRIRVLRDDTRQELFRCILEHVCEQGIDCLQVSRQPEATRKAVSTYILKPDLSPQEIAAVEDQGLEGFWTDLTRHPLLLFRGLLAGGVLGFCFGQKRWRVNYGPDSTRKPPTKLAVPYRAKDSPAPRAEFSHPDVIIVLTSLSYYYAGLIDDDLFLAFSHLLKSDQADVEYQGWVTDAPTLPCSYHDLVGINIGDPQHCIEHVFPYLRFSKSLIDYFLAHIVFPKEMKEFPEKLSTSGWDIGEPKSYPTLGFSGTNDSRTTLPLSVEQLDLPEQNHTNALVLEYLLRPENDVAFCPAGQLASRPEVQGLLDILTSLGSPAQVILDVGARILELSNFEVAREWLKLTPEPTQAVVFFNDYHELCVWDRQGCVELLQTSPFAKQLELCHVFLDEAHTRGTDLKLPERYRAVVTLGAGLTKDKLVQACMRMRKLGKGQSVVFYIPEEIKRNIMALTGKHGERDIDVSDVLCWAISGTWVDTRRSIPLWAVQGQRFGHQSTLWSEARKDGQIQMSSSHAGKYLEPEFQSLESRYRPGHQRNQLFHALVNGAETNHQILERCHEFEDLNLNSTQLQEEQERELAPEIEQERQVQRPAPAEPATHRLHPDLEIFVATGKLVRTSNAYKPAFQMLRNTSASVHLDVSQFPPDLHATEDFAMTVQVSGTPSFTSDAYERPVQWILTSVHDNMVSHMIIISPYEANQLVSKVRRSRNSRLHLYAPRQNMGFLSLDKLSLYNVPAASETPEIPTSLRNELNLFAGQLYIATYGEYLELCDFLGVASRQMPEGWSIAADGFIVRDNMQTSTSSFRQSPLKFLKTFMTQVRKDREEINKTHVGMVLDGKQLSQSDFEE